MPTKGTSVKGIRLPDSTWATLDEQARLLGMSRNEFIGRRILHVPVVAKPDESITDTDEEREVLDD